MKKARTITKEMTINEVFQKYPKSASVFTAYGLYCVGCPMAQDETIELVARSNQIDLKKLLDELNKAAKP